MWRALGKDAIVSQPAKIRLWLISCLPVVEVVPSSAYPRINAVKGNYWSHVFWKCSLFLNLPHIWKFSQILKTKTADMHNLCHCCPPLSSQYSIKKWRNLLGWDSHPLNCNLVENMILLHPLVYAKLQHPVVNVKLIWVKCPFMWLTSSRMEHHVGSQQN